MLLVSESHVNLRARRRRADEQRSLRGDCSLLLLTKYQGVRRSSFQFTTWFLRQKPKQVGTRRVSNPLSVDPKYSIKYGRNYHDQYLSARPQIHCSRHNFHQSPTPPSCSRVGRPPITETKLNADRISFCAVPVCPTSSLQELLRRASRLSVDHLHPQTTLRQIYYNSTSDGFPFGA